MCKSHIGYSAIMLTGGLADGGKREDFCGAGFMAVACVVAPGRYRLRAGHAAARPHVSGRDKHRLQQAGVRKAAG